MAGVGVSSQWRDRLIVWEWLMAAVAETLLAHTWVVQEAETWQEAGPCPGPQEPPPGTHFLQQGSTS